jgi:acyl dehydratase
MAMELKYDRSLHDNEHKAGPFEITAKMIERLNESLGETNPALTSSNMVEGARVKSGWAKGQGLRAMLAPPTLCSIFMREVNLPDVGIEFGQTRMHAGQRLQPKAPVYAGDRLTASSYLKDVYAKTGRSGTMVFIVWETTFQNQDGEVVAEIQESFALRE